MIRFNLLRPRIVFSALTAIATMVVSPLAIAAEEQYIEEIIVTANKREESIQDVSVAVTAISGAQLSALGITDSFSLDKLVPGLQLGQSGSDPRPAMRGARTQQVEANDVAVAFYTDGLYRPRHGQMLAGFVDTERVEVLRGPQGTLFGRNTLGGLIHVISNKPTTAGTDFGFAFTGGDYSQIKGEGFFNLPLGDTAALRVAGATETRDPYVENTFIGDKGGLKDADYSYVRAQLAFTPSDNLDINIRAEFWSDDSNGNGSFGYYAEGVPIDPVTGMTNGTTGVMQPRIGQSSTQSGGRGGAGIDATAQATTGDPYKIHEDTRNERDLEETTWAADINWSFSAVDLKVTLAYMDYEEFRWADCDFSINAGTRCGNDITSETTQAEVQLISNTDGKFQWVAGFFYLQEDLTDAFLWYDVASSVDNVPVVPADRNTYAGWANEIRVDTASTAVYAQGTYAVSDTVRIIGGVRYTEDDRDWKIWGQDADLTTQNFSVLEVPDGTGDWDDVTWKVAAEVDVNEDSMAYASVSTGFLSGNQQGAFQGTNTYDQQKVTAYEIGSKNLLADGRVLLNLSLYFNEFEDMLVTRFVDTDVTTLAFAANAGEIKALGLEVEFDWAATDQLQLGARLSFTNAEYGDFTLPNVYQTGGNHSVGDRDNLFQLDGLQVQNSPDFTSTLLGSYTIELGSSGTLVPAVTFYYTDDYRVDDSPFNYGDQDSYTKTDISLTWISANANLRVRAFVTNLEDEATLTKATRFGGDIAFTDYANPRTWGVTFSYGM